MKVREYANEDGRGFRSHSFYISRPNGPNYKVVLRFDRNTVVISKRLRPSDNWR